MHLFNISSDEEMMENEREFDCVRGVKYFVDEGNRQSKKVEEMVNQQVYTELLVI